MRYVAGFGHASAGNDAWREWHALGALQLGWVTADALGMAGDDEAAAGARQLLQDAEQLRLKLNVSDQRLCQLVSQSCARLRARRLELLSSADASGTS